MQFKVWRIRFMELNSSWGVLEASLAVRRYSLVCLCASWQEGPGAVEFWMYGGNSAPYESLFSGYGGNCGYPFESGALLARNTQLGSHFKPIIGQWKWIYLYYCEQFYLKVFFCSRILFDKLCVMARRNHYRCCCRCGCRRKPGSRRVECSGCGHHVCPGYCLGMEINGIVFCRKCLNLSCDGVPEGWQLTEILEHRFYVSLLSCQARLNVDAGDPVMHLLAQYLRLQ